MKVFSLKHNIFSKKGFTLVEMMVAVAVFSIVMVVAAGALLNVVDANQKARSIETAINNINFALESISKDMRVGTEFECLDSGGNVVACSDTGNPGVRYNSGIDEDTGDTIYISYLFEQSGTPSIGRVQKDIEVGIDSTGFEDITSPDINITDMKFYVVQGLVGENKLQPRVVITLSGIAGSKVKTQTTFDLQTSVSQRARTNN